MKTLLHTIKWDAILIYKYGIAAVAFAIAALYSIGFLFVDSHGFEKWVVALIFSDPVMYGFLFTAVMMLFEKDARTQMALAVTPLTSKLYLWSKAITFTALALVTSSLIMLTAHTEAFHFIWFLLAVVFSSALFVFVGVIGVSFVQNFNQFILVIPIVLAPVCLPFLPFFGLAKGWYFYLIPTQACLLLFQASVEPIVLWKKIYALLYLGIATYFAYKWAYRSYQKRILKTDRP